MTKQEEIEENKETQKTKKRVIKKNEELGINKEAFTFFVGAIVALLGGASVSALFEFSKSVFAKDAILILGYWGIISTFAGVAFFQLTKFMLIKIGIKTHLYRLDFVSVIIPIIFVVALIFFFLLGY